MEVIVSPTKKFKVLGDKMNIIENIEPAQMPLKQQQVPMETDKVENIADAAETEPLLAEVENSYVIFPIKHHQMWQMYKELVGTFWSPTEALQNLASYALNDNELEFLKTFASYYASPQSIGIVNENLAEEFARVIQVTEAKFFYGHQTFVQNMHYEMYSKIMEKLVPSEEARNKIFRTIEAQHTLDGKLKWLDSFHESGNFNQQLVASACMHGLFFTVLNLMSLWLNNRSKRMLSQELLEIFDKMVLEQKIQCEFACLMISSLKNKPSKEFIDKTVEQATKIEFEFLNELNFDLIGLEAKDLLQMIDAKVKALKGRLLDSIMVDAKISSKASSASISGKFNASTNSMAGMVNENKMETATTTNTNFTLDEDF